MKKLVLIFLLFLIASHIALSIYIAEGVLHPERKRLCDRDRARAENIAKRNGVSLIDAEIVNKDAALRGWYFKKSNSDRVVVLFHGQSDNRAGMLPFADLFLRHGYSVLSPDSRAHGNSGGDSATYGVREVEDVHEWIDWLIENESVKEVFGMGESMGAAILLQSVATEKRWKAVVAESSFCDFRQIAKERLHG
ncbi:lysophospholipase, partial [bacterium]|nr:lysophospholipase [bacterium]MCI0603673.1 lysophospholipase [bacterium]